MLDEIKNLPLYKFKFELTKEMQVYTHLFKGSVAKHIERQNIFHANDVHIKQLVVKLKGQPEMILT